jgi:hypothetical protein
MSVLYQYLCLKSDSPTQRAFLVHTELTTIAYAIEMRTVCTVGRLRSINERDGLLQ